MPAYDYACNNCGHRFEKNQSMSEAPLKICPECDTEALRKVFSATGLVFKGTGWYKMTAAPAQPIPRQVALPEPAQCSILIFS